MGITHRAPQYNATRRIKGLFLLVVVATIVAIAAWFAIARAIDTQISAGIEQQQQAGGLARCDNQEVRGFPFRFGVFCDTAALGDGRLSVETGAIRSAAQFYSPNHIIVEIDAPLVLRTDDQTITTTWDTARASIHRGSPLPRRASVQINQPRLQLPNLPPLTAGALTAHMRTLRQADDRGGETGDLDIAAQITAPDVTPIIPAEATLPDFNIDLDATIKQAIARIQAGERETLLADSEITLHRLGLILNDDSGLLANGALTTDALGRLSGSVDVRLIDVDAVIAALNRALPGNQSIIGLLGSLPRSGPDNDETSLTLTINEGRMSFGFIPLGTLAPLL